jgi:hypothetical protein
MDSPRLLMLEVAEQVAAATLVSHLPGIAAVSGWSGHKQPSVWQQPRVRVRPGPSRASQHLNSTPQVHLLEPERGGQPQRLQTEGINFAGLWQQQQLLDVNRCAWLGRCGTVDKQRCMSRHARELFGVGT